MVILLSISCQYTSLTVLQPTAFEIRQKNAQFASASKAGKNPQRPSRRDELAHQPRIPRWAVGLLLFALAGGGQYMPFPFRIPLIHTPTQPSLNSSEFSIHPQRASSRTLARHTLHCFQLLSIHFHILPSPDPHARRPCTDNIVLRCTRQCPHVRFPRSPAKVRRRCRMTCKITLFPSFSSLLNL
jgi:hypothetical protein